MKLFVVDDEEMIRGGIRKCIDREPRYTICGEAQDGEMALPLIQELQPDILIADVRMPFMDGLELSAWAKKAMPWMHVLILSGHDEFEYAQKAVSIGVDAYLLKPISSDKLLSALGEIEARMEREKQSYLEAARHQERDKTEKAIIRDHFLSRVVTGTARANEIFSTAEQNGIGLIARHYLVCRARLTGITEEGLARVRLLCETLFEGRADVVWFLKGVDHLLFLVLGDSGEGVLETAYETAQILRHELARYLSLDVAVGIGSIVSRIGEVPRSYRAAVEVMDNALVREAKILGAADREARPGPRFDVRSNAPLQEKLRHASLRDLPALVEDYFAAAGDDGANSVLLRYYLLMDLLVTAARQTGEEDYMKRMMGDNPQKVLGVAQSREEAISFGLEVLTDILSRDGEQGDAPYAQEIRRAKDYIRENFSDPAISLHTVAKEVGFSPNHFSTVFSQQTGETFIEHLTQRRIEAAKRLLVETDRKLSDIAWDIGYNDPHYFSYVFKKRVGMSPREYRGAKS